MLQLNGFGIFAAIPAYALGIVLIVHTPASAQSLSQSPDVQADITNKLKMTPPAASNPEVTAVSSSSALNLAFGLPELKSIYDANGFGACQPSAPAHGFAAKDWAQAPALCLDLARESYATGAAREYFKEGVFGIPQHPSVETKPETLVKGLSDRVFLQSAQRIASAKSSLFAAALGGKLEFSVPLQAEMGRRPNRSVSSKVRYVVVYEEQPISGSVSEPLISQFQRGNPPLVLASISDHLEVSRLHRTILFSQSQRHDSATFRSSKRLIEVAEESQQGQRDDSIVAQRSIIPRMGGLAYSLGLQKPLFSGLSARLDRGGANRPQDVKMSLFESSASVLFAEMKPFSDQDPEKTVSYGYALPYHNSRFSVQHFLGDSSKIYTAELRKASHHVVFSIEEKTEQMKIVLGMNL